MAAAILPIHGLQGQKSARYVRFSLSQGSFLSLPTQTYDDWCNMDLIIEFVKLLLIISLSVTGAGFGVVLADTAIRYTYQHRITEVGIEIMLFGKFPIKHIPFSHIIEVRRASIKEVFSFRSIFTALRFGVYRIRGVCVLVRLKEGVRIFPFPDVFRRKILLFFPDNADGFIHKIRQHL